MVSKYQIKIVTAVLLTLGQAIGVSAVRLETITQNKQTIIRIENVFLKAEINASSGARISSLIPKCDGIERVWWKNDGRSGLLDDKAGFTDRAYKFKVIENNSHRITVAFFARAGGLQITKEITLIENEPALRVKYLYKNVSGSKMILGKMVRNYYLAGGKAGTEDKYYWRGPRGIECKAYPYGGTGVFHKTEARWYGVIDSKKQTGLVWLIDSPALSSFYNWADHSPKNPAVEWKVNLELSAGKTLEVPIVIGFVRGLDGITDVSSKSVMNIKMKTDGKRTLRILAQCYFFSRLDEKNPVALRCDYETLDRKSVGGEVGTYFRKVRPGRVFNGESAYTLPEEGTYIVIFRLQQSDTTFNHFELPVVVGKSTGNYYKGAREKKIHKPIITIEQEDIKDGYVIHLGGKASFYRAEQIKFSMGFDEYESIELGIIALRELGSITMNIESKQLPADAVKIKCQNGTAGTGEKLAERQYGLCDGNKMLFPAGSHKSFWLIFCSYKLKEGKYPFRIVIYPQKAPKRELNGLLTVFGVKRTHRRLLRLYYTFSYNNSKRRKHEAILISHHCKHLMVDWHKNIWKRAVVLKLQNGKSAIKAEFTGLDRLLKPSLHAGFDTIEMMYGFYNSNWVRPIVGLPAKQKQRMLRDFGNQLVQHLLDIGFRQVWYCAMDEPSITKATSPKTRNRLMFLKSLHPELKLNVAINHYSPKLINLLNKYIDVWIPTSSNGVCLKLVNDIRHRRVKVDSSDLVGFYQQGRYFSSADKIRRWGWLAGMYSVNFYSIFAYNQSPHNAAYKLFVYDSQNNPVTTPALEGLRDGFEEYEYLDKLKSLVKQLSRDRRFLSASELNDLKNAKAFLISVFAVKGKKSIFSFSIMPGIGGGNSWYDFKYPNRWKFLKVKGMLLSNIAKLEKIKNCLR